MRNFIGKMFNKNEKSVIVTKNDTAKLVYELLVEGKTLYQLSKIYKNSSEILNELGLNDEHCGNFKNIRKGAMFGALRYYKRYDILNLLEIYFYGVANNQTA